MRRASPPLLGAAVPLALAAAGCGLLFPGPEGGPPAPAAEREEREAEARAENAEIPAGYGTLRQEEISVDLRRAELRIRITPLAESVIRVTAPDTHERLSALARGHQSLFRERTGSAVPFQLFLVSLYTETGNVTFEPEDLNLVSRGLRYRPVDIRPITPGWDRRFLGPRETLMAIYAFPPGVELDRDLEVEYQEVRSREWERILPVVEAERARVRVRAPSDLMPRDSLRWELR